MCGIAALLLRAPEPWAAPTLRRMLALQHSRGPDWTAQDSMAEGRVHLGHNRLAIVDLSPAGRQPMRFGRLTLIYNGEIYNWRELRRELEAKGRRFVSQSDSEVLLQLYDERGPAMLEALRGMFAFALWDDEAGELFCARDRLGKKPLIYGEAAAGLVVASELPAALLVPGIDRSVDPLALAIYLLRNFRHIPDPYTLYRGLRRLPPGHAMVARGGRVERIWRWWRPRLAERDVAADEVLAKLDEAVGLRRLADVEVAAMLSGGVDSTAIVDSMIRQGSEGVRSYALGAGPEDEELVRAEAAARRLGSRHKAFHFDPARHHEHFLRLLRLHGEPIALLPLGHAYELCRRIRDDGVKVAVTGHGADEIFYGYGGFLNLARLTPLLELVPALARPALAALARRLPPGSRREALTVAAARPGARKAALYRDEAGWRWPQLLRPQELPADAEAQVGALLETWVGDLAPRRYVDESALTGLMQENAHSVTILGDLPAMAASVETRCPFLDHEMVELAFSIPYRRKVGGSGEGGRLKLILKQALESRLPRDLLYAPKRGFGYRIQEADVLAGPWKAEVDGAFAALDDLDGLIDRAGAVALKARFDATRTPADAMLVHKLYALHVSRRLTDEATGAAAASA